MLYFTKYAENKFEILNKYKIFFTREQIEEVINMPDKVSKKGKYLVAKKDTIKVVYKKDGKLIRIYTFYPIKS
ncbi:MAG: hypothetical protein ABH830_01050 [Patescibacteria group bacterium]